MKNIRELDLKNKKVLIRCDLNVPIEDGRITDDNRIKESIPTLEYLIHSEATIIILSHLGRIKEESDKEKNSLAPVAEKLSEYLGTNVRFINKTRNIGEIEDGEIVMLENTRFEDYPNNLESNNDPELGKYWASLGDVYINDAFGTAHRAHASNVGIASNIKEKAIGFLMEKETTIISEALNNPNRPFTVILGGAKVKDKIGVIENLVKVADKILIAGGMTYTFLKAKGYEIGTSLLDEESLGFCKKMLEAHKDKIVLPIDTHVADEFSKDAKSRIKSVESFDKKEMGMDIGPKTIELFDGILKSSKTVIWNGPCGVFEFDKFATGTKAVLETLSKIDGTVIIGGGDSGSAAIQFGYENAFTRISTGGGATLTMLEGKELPGIEAIKN